MRFQETKTLTIRDGGFYWAEYQWDSGSAQWCYRRSNEGFHRRYELPSRFTEAERLLLEIQLSDA